jgi:hypothetical protein
MSNGAQDSVPTFPIGQHSDYWENTAVIGSLDKSPSGNTLLRLGHLVAENRGWTQSHQAHITLSPDEREALIAALIAQR